MMDHIILNHEVVIKKLSPIGSVRLDTSNLCSCEKNVFRFFVMKEIGNSPLIPEVQLFLIFKTKLEYPSERSFRPMADPTIPLCPAIYIFDDCFNSIVEFYIVRLSFLFCNERSDSTISLIKLLKSYFGSQPSFVLAFETVSFLIVI